MRIYFSLVAMLLLCLSHHVCASVVMTGTRIIYPAQASNKSIQLKNPDQQPYIVHVQVDDGSEKKPADEEDSNFLLTPNIFRMEPGSAQTVLLKYIGNSLPQNKESIFYMNFTQLPATKSEKSGSNQLVLAITNRVKIFYRPQGIEGTPGETAKKMTFSLSGKKIKVTNSAGYFAVVRRASLVINGREIKLADRQMVAPQSSAEWLPSAPVSGLKGARLRLVLVNDYGIDVINERTL